MTFIPKDKVDEYLLGQRIEQERPRIQRNLFLGDDYFRNLIRERAPPELFLSGASLQEAINQNYDAIMNAIKIHDPEAYAQELSYLTRTQLKYQRNPQEFIKFLLEWREILETETRNGDRYYD